MKIALLTIHRTGNYGAVLQAFATKHILSRFGEVTIIDYDSRHLAHHIDLIRFEFSKRGFLMMVHDVLRFPYRFKAISKFNSFFDEFFNLSPQWSAQELVDGSAYDFDVYVCGSDQIWNPEIVSADSSIDPIYFLDFVPTGKQKISYASSIGHYLFDEDESCEVRKHLNDFSMISTRESDGAKQLRKILPHKDIFHVLDPTLLLSNYEWLNALGIEEREISEKYILVYSVPRTDLIKKVVNYYSSKLGLKVIAIDQMLTPPASVDEHIRDAGPKDFVELYSNAAFIITDSFHGTCFSLIFNKPFVSVSAGKRASRIVSLLTLANMMDRFVESEKDLDQVPLDLSMVESVEIKTQSKISLDILTSSF